VREYGFHGEYREIVPPERIVWTFEFEGFPGEVSVETLTLEEHDGKTTFTATSVYDTVEARDGMLSPGWRKAPRSPWTGSTSTSRSSRSVRPADEPPRRTGAGQGGFRARPLPTS
jgi:hypothetical protein